MDKGEENRGSIQIRINPFNPRGQVWMTTTTEIRLNFLDVDPNERRTLNGDITKQINPTGRRLYAQGNAYRPLFCCFNAPKPSSATKIEYPFRRGWEVIYSQSAEHSDKNHMIPVVTVFRIVNAVYQLV